MLNYIAKLHQGDSKVHEEENYDTSSLLCETLYNSFKEILLLVVLIFFSSSAQAQLSEVVEISGYVKELGQLSLNNDLSSARYDNILHHRFETDWTFSEHFEFRADLRTRLLNGYTVNNTPGLEQFYTQDPNYFDLSWVWFNTNHSLLHSNIDRLHLSYINGPWEVHAGRQRINWGRTYVWNPNDLFNNYAFLDFDYEERPGVDALLAQYNWSFASSVEAGIRLGASWDETVVGSMVRTSWGNYDIQFTAGHYLDDVTIGAGWAGYIKDAGFKGEISYFHPEDQFWDRTGHFTATAGLDYMFSNGIYTQAELLYNGGYNQQANPLSNLVRPPSANDLFIAKTGFFLNGAYQIHPLVNSNLGFMGSFDRSIFIIIPQVTVSVTENVDFLLLSQLLKGSVFNQSVETPNLLYFRLKWSY